MKTSPLACLTVLIVAGCFLQIGCGKPDRTDGGHQHQEDVEKPVFDEPYQYEQLDLIFEPVHASKVIAFEGTLGSEKDESIEVPGLENLLPSANELDFAQPLIYERSTTGDLAASVIYVFSQPDSTVRYMACRWRVDIEDPKEQERAEARHFRLQGGIYAYIKGTLVSMLGLPDQDEIIDAHEGSSIQYRISRWKTENRNLSLLVAPHSRSAGITVYWE